MTLPLLRPLLAAILLTVSALAAGAQDFATYRNERHGFSLSYPAGTFARGPLAERRRRVFVSRDGNARLLAGALPNDGGMGLRDYRAFVLQAELPGRRTSTTHRCATTGSCCRAPATA